MSDQGYNWHDNLLIFTDDPADTEVLLSSIRDRWLEAAARAGTRADGPQRAEPVRNMHKVTGYATKGLMASAAAAHNPTPKDFLSRYAYQGDQAAGDLWHELETFFQSGRRILTMKGGALRKVKKKIPVSDQQPHTPRSKSITVDDYLELAPGLSIPQKAEELGCSHRTVQNRRAETDDYMEWLCQLHRGEVSLVA